MKLYYKVLYPGKESLGSFSDLNDDPKLLGLMLQKRTKKQTFLSGFHPITWSDLY